MLEGLFEAIENAEIKGGSIEIYSKDTLDWMIKEYGLKIIKERYNEGRLIICDEEVLKYFEEKC